MYLEVICAFHVVDDAAGEGGYIGFSHGRECLEALIPSYHITLSTAVWRMLTVYVPDMIL